MNTISRLILIATLGAVPTAHAQTPTAKAGLAALPTPDGALLRWFLPGDATPSGGFVIEVKGSAATRTVPVSSPQPYSAALGLTRPEYDAVTATYTAPVTDDNRVGRAIFTLNVVARPAFARALGIQTTLIGLPEGTYTATVYAVDRTRTPVGTATFRTGPTPPVPAPTNLTLLPGATPRLRWTPPTEPGALVAAYTVSRAGSTGPFQPLEPTPFFRTGGAGGDVFTDTTAQPGQTYRYQVSSVDLFGRDSAPSAPVTFSAAAPLPTPVLTRAEPGNRKVTLTWTADPDPRVTAVLVLRGPAPDQLAVIATLPADARTFADQVQGGVPYLYAVATTDQTGQLSGRSTLAGATGQNLTPPAAPSGLNVTATETSLTLTWTPNREGDLLGYRVYRSEGAQTPAEALLLTGLPLTDPTFTDVIPQGVQTPYRYQVVAVNTTQVDSELSAPVTGVLKDVTPPPPPLLAAATATPGGIQLSWTQATVPDLQTFEVLRATATTSAVLTQLPAGTRTYLDTTAAPGSTVTYTLRSVDRSGNRSAESAPLTATRPAPAGGSQVSGLRAALLPNQGGVQLTWTASQPGGQYVVYRLRGQHPLELSGLLSTPTYTDPAGTADAQYVVRAVDAAGNFSDPTPPTSATP
ncbi:fibronectin type III domain-containing protein [Deinococcus radiotolerans]|uniref:Fibronectin type-III domain-containing protein n=1 Tax=Deinococcus radiotolerans TaxID=1309407 RepID=A0ABQ2FKV6_9DEIO|nr:hypothetical protein [Deinococcus radiotolerans]GGL07903.1 hypothetical protein GCM10010844_28300 [Deinococcus radiotolerans]